MRLIVGIAAVAVLLVAGVAAWALLDDEDEPAEAAAVRIAGDQPSVRGVAHFVQDGDELTGLVVVWGLAPNSTHAVHFHGPGGRCGTKADPVAIHPDLQADGDGIAYTEVDIAAESPLLDGGYYYNVHGGPSTQAENPEIACGDIAP